MTKEEWIKTHLGDALWKIEGDQIVDSFRPPGRQIVGTIKRAGSEAVITLNYSGTTSTLPDWVDSENEGKS